MKRLLLICLIVAAANQLLHAQGWTELGIGSHALNANIDITAVCTDAGGIVYTAGYFTDGASYTSGHPYVAKWDGTSWSKLGAGSNVPDSFINTMCLDKYHNLYAAGGFTDANGKQYVAKWNGTMWSELGTGANALNANHPIYTLCADDEGNIYAAGLFTDGPDAATGYRYVAKWDGTTWSKLGTGVNALNPNGEITSIVADHDGNVYAAGVFLNAPGGYYYVAKWNGTTWGELGTGSNALNANSYITTMCKDTADNIFVGGNFKDGSGKTYVAKWNGSTWSELGAGANALNGEGTIFSLCTDVWGNVFAAGRLFYAIGDYYVAKWDGTAWGGTGSGSNALNANAVILSLCTDNSGNLYAAGEFTDSLDYDKGHQYVAKYAGSNLGINSFAVTNNLLTVYPNPSSSLLIVCVPEPITNQDYVIYDLSGKPVLSGKLAGKYTYLNVSRLPSGSYLLRAGACVDQFEKQ